MGTLFELGAIYYLGVVVSAAVLYYQHRLIAIKGFGAFTREYYMRNGIVSVAMFFFTLVSVFLK
jgi:4-hydroxybenzoate polyprenyltransferase